MRKPQGWGTHCGDQAAEGAGQGGEGILENYFDI